MLFTCTTYCIIKKPPNTKTRTTYNLDVSMDAKDVTVQLKPDSIDEIVQSELWSADLESDNVMLGQPKSDDESDEDPEPEAPLPGAEVSLTGGDDKIGNHKPQTALEAFLLKEHVAMRASHNKVEGEAAGAVRDHFDGFRASSLSEALNNFQRDTLFEMQRTQAVIKASVAEGTSELVEFPKLGNKPLTQKIRKGFSTLVAGQTYSGSETDPSGMILSGLLTTLASTVYDEKLNAHAVWQLLAQCTSGQARNIVNLGMLSASDISTTWKILQQFSRRAVSEIEIKNKIQRILHARPASAGAILMELCSLHATLLSTISKSERKTSGRYLLRESLLRAVENWWPQYLAQIVEKDKDAQRSWALERSSLRQSGRSLDEAKLSYSPINSLVSLILVTIGNTPAAGYHPMPYRPRPPLQYPARQVPAAPAVHEITAGLDQLSMTGGPGDQLDFDFDYEDKPEVFVEAAGGYPYGGRAGQPYERQGYRRPAQAPRVAASTQEAQAQKVFADFQKQLQAVYRQGASAPGGASGGTTRPPPPPPELRCELCGRKGHGVGGDKGREQCYRYGDMQPSSEPCVSCGWYHLPAPCLEDLKMHELQEKRGGRVRVEDNE